jgi:hypothetical protein
MSSEISSRLKRVTVASESTYLTDAVNTILTDGALDLIHQNFKDADIVPARVVGDASRIRNSHSGHKHFTVGDRCVVTFEVPLTARVGSGAGDEAPYHAPVLKAMNLKETVVSSTSATYNPATAAQEAITVYMWEQELEDTKQRLTYTTGVRGTGVFKFALNQEAMYSFTGVGTYQGELSNRIELFNPTTGAVSKLKDGTTSATARTTGEEKYADKDAMVCTGMTITWNGTTFDIGELELNLNWTTSTKEIINNANNVSKVLLTRDANNRIGGSFELVDGAELTTLFSAVTADTEGQMVIELDDGTDKITITADKVQLGYPTKGDTSGMRSYSVPFFLNGDWSTLAGDNDFSMVFAAS